VSNPTTSIIVYRNPAEQAFWESGLLFPLICSLVVAMGVAYVLSLVYECLPWNIRSQKWPSNLLIALTIASCIGTLFYMI